MAEWKKIIVSGSDAHLASVTASNLTNDNLVIAGTGGALESSGITYDGTTFNLGSSTLQTTGDISGSNISGSFFGDGAGLTGVSGEFPTTALGGTSLDAIKFFVNDGASKFISGSQIDDYVYSGVSGDATIAADGALTIAATAVEGTMLNTNVADGTTIELSSDTLSVLKVPNALTDVAGGGLNDFSFDGSSAVSLEVSGAVDLTDNTITKWDDTSGKFVNSSLTDDGTNITGTTSIQLTGASSNLSGSFSGSFFGDGTGLTGIATTLNIDAKENIGDGTPDDLAVDLKTQTLTLQGTANEVEVNGSDQTITIGLPDNVTIGSNLNVTGDLTVSGTTTTLNTANLLVEDRFALFNSGSDSGDGGFIVQTETNSSGAAFGWDDSEGRFAFQIGTKLAHDATTIAPDAYAAAVVTADDATYQKNGNIRVEGGDIFIYVE